ncbi:hypothetical protein BZA77DRAFT_314638 [Pyronema omphalodes]|nr:hypothetical protein BZA77DRAFT_314638 [Pyronema omphalodes]
MSLLDSSPLLLVLSPAVVHPLPADAPRLFPSLAAVAAATRPSRTLPSPSTLTSSPSTTSSPTLISTTMSWMRALSLFTPRV